MGRARDVQTKRIVGDSGGDRMMFDLGLDSLAVLCYRIMDIPPRGGEG